jgi:hypothetical protein
MDTLQLLLNAVTVIFIAATMSPLFTVSAWP